MDYKTNEYLGASLTEESFLRLSRFIEGECGIKMPPAKKTMLESRLRKRLRSLGMDSFEEYSEFVLSPQGMEVERFNMINEVCTNKTDFFREPAHYDYLYNQALPDLLGRYRTGFKRSMNIWSAGCSTGKEPYTLAFVLNEFAQNNVGFEFSILGTDISTKALNLAVKAVYKKERIEPVPEHIKKKYFMRNRERDLGLVRVVPEIRAKVKYRRLNFLDDEFGIVGPMDIIFCRNVIIYFKRDTQKRFINRLCEHLTPGGYLFMGHSETLHSMKIPLVPQAPSVYRKPG